MKLLRSLSNWLAALLLSLFKRSLKSHASIRVSDLDESKNFYEKLGFRQVTSTRGREVVLLRNHRGDELNLVPLSPGTDFMTAGGPGSVSFEVARLERDLEKIEGWYPNLEIARDSTSRHVSLKDPDSNVIELFETLAVGRRPKKRVFHVASHTELVAGLSDQYYMPPDGEYRFVRCGAYSMYVAFACKEIARESDSTPLVIEMDQSELSIEEEWLDAEIDTNRPSRFSTFPLVHRPIRRQAIIGVGESVEDDDGGFGWPRRFRTLDAIIAPT